MTSRLDRLVTTLAADIYKGYMDWEKREYGRTMQTWEKLHANDQRPFKTMARMIVMVRRKEGKVRA